MNRALSPSPAACPKADELATFFEGRLRDSRRAALVAHLADCGECRAALGSLGRQNASEPPVVPASLLATAAGQPARQRRRTVAALIAAAACVLLAVSVARQSPEQAGDDVSAPVVADPVQLPDDVRAKSAGVVPQLMEPKVGATLSAPTRFEWTPVANAVQYQLHVLTGEGDIVFDATTAETTIDFGGPDARQGPLYAWVSAQLTDGRRVQSAVVRLAGPSR